MNNEGGREILMDQPKHRRIAEAYRQMAETALYRPQAPSDLMGHVLLSAEKYLDPKVLHDEAAKYASNFMQDERTCSFFIGNSGYEANRALVYLVEAARTLCTRNYELATTLVKMAAIEVESVAQQYAKEIEKRDE
jgi:hypothetical protein